MGHSQQWSWAPSHTWVVAADSLTRARNNSDQLTIWSDNGSSRCPTANGNVRLKKNARLTGINYPRLSSDPSFVRVENPSRHRVIFRSEFSVNFPGSKNTI